jgi:hypothetical protein
LLATDFGLILSLADVLRANYGCCPERFTLVTVDFDKSRDFIDLEARKGFTLHARLRDARDASSFVEEMLKQHRAVVLFPLRILPQVPQPKRPANSRSPFVCSVGKHHSFGHASWTETDRLRIGPVGTKQQTVTSKD